jgi:hypothetical protein
LARCDRDFADLCRAATLRAVHITVVVIACACEPRLLAEPGTVTPRSAARPANALPNGKGVLADRLARAREYRQRLCGGYVSGPAMFLRYPEVVAWTAAEPRAVVSDGGFVCWVEDGDPQRIFAVPAAGGAPREVAISAAVRDLRAHRGALYWSDGERVLRAAIEGGARAPVVEGGRLAVRGDLLLTLRHQAIWISALDGTVPRRLAMLPEEHTVDDLALSDDAVWALVSEPDGIAALLLRIDLATGNVEERARTRLGLAVAVAREHVIFARLTETLQIPRAGGPSRTVSRSPHGASKLFAAGDVVFGVSDCGGTVIRVDEARGAVDVLASGLGALQGVTVDGHHIVWADLTGDSRGVILRMSLAPR